MAKLYLLRAAPEAVVIGSRLTDLRQEQQRFREFLDEIAASRGVKPPLQFMHLELPHAPYMLTADGKIHPQSPSGFDPRFAGHTALLQRLRSDYLQQIEFVDGELVLLDQLKQAGIYDSALIIVTSDHGVSWKPEAPGRTLTKANADMIFPVPLFIKLPGQTVGRISSQDAQLIDLVPTIAAVAGVKVPWQVAGHDLFATGAPVREKIMIDANDKKFAYPPTFASTNPNTP